MSLQPPAGHLSAEAICVILSSEPQLAGLSVYTLPSWTPGARLAFAAQLRQVTQDRPRSSNRSFCPAGMTAQSRTVAPPSQTDSTNRGRVPVLLSSRQ